jgi:hypothetical protein
LLKGKAGLTNPWLIIFTNPVSHIKNLNRKAAYPALAWYIQSCLILV